MFKTAEEENLNQVLEWNQIFVDTLIATNTPNSSSQRLGAIVHTAIFDAYNGIERRYTPVFIPQSAPSGASRRAAVIAAAHTALVGLFPARQPSLNASYVASLAALSDDGEDGGQSRERGIAWGTQVAQAVLAWRATDGFMNVSYPSFFGGTAIGQWRPTPPLFLPMSAQGLAFTAMFVLDNNTQFRPRPPRALTSPTYTDDFNAVKALGRNTGSTRTEEQTALALFWEGNASTHWNQAANQIARANNLSLSDSNRLLASDQRADRFIEKSTVALATMIIQNRQDHSLIGQTIGHYKISKPIGTGGMGDVYLATDIIAGRKAALKLLPTRFTGDPERLKRFQQEAHAVVGLNHPNILTVYEIGEDHSIHYIASELIEGETLRQRLLRGRLELSEAVDIAIQVASALAAAHQAGIVHRDIKPENIMLRPDGYVKVLDFGIAKLAEQEVPVTIPRDEALLLVETNLGSILGTIRYMSPEQTWGAQVDKSTDIWSRPALWCSYCWQLLWPLPWQRSSRCE
jgi:hypothetical protein